MAERGEVLIAALSGRALAVSARRGGYLPLVADFFSDQDTLAAAAACVRLKGRLADGIDGEEVVAALAELARSRRPQGVVCGSGFEDRPDVLARVAEDWRLLGNSPETIASVKDPVAFAELCRGCGIPHPETSLLPPAELAGWLSKRRGGAGGSHIAAAPDRSAGEGRYFQRSVGGSPVSAQFLADGRRAVLLGLSTQWPSPTPERPFRYGGAVQPAVLPSRLAAQIEAAAGRLVAAAGLVGLNSADFLIEEDDFYLLEVNPRPGATLDIFEPRRGSLFAMHVAACEGVLPARPPPALPATASAIVYAERDIPVLPHLAWPAWTADRPRAGTAFAAGDPLCTVQAAARTPIGARGLVNERLVMVVEWTHAEVP